MRVVAWEGSAPVNQAEINRLVRVAGGEDAALRRLEIAVGELRAIKDAQAALQQLPAEDLRSALEARNRVLLRVVS